MLGLQEWTAVQIAPVQAQLASRLILKNNSQMDLRSKCECKGKKKRKTGRDKIS